jgi:hypothetical protein
VLRPTRFAVLTCELPARAAASVGKEITRRQRRRVVYGSSVAEPRQDGPGPVF